MKTMHHLYSAKELLKNESNVAYICSRYYRAPELILGAKDYTYKIGQYLFAHCECFFKESNLIMSKAPFSHGCKVPQDVS